VSPELNASIRKKKCQCSLFFTFSERWNKLNTKKAAVIYTIRRNREPIGTLATYPLRLTTTDSELSELWSVCLLCGITETLEMSGVMVNRCHRLASREAERFLQFIFRRAQLTASKPTPIYKRSGKSTA